MDNNDRHPGDATPETRAGLKGRRRVLEIIGTSAVAVPVLGLAGCGSDDGGSAASAPKASLAPMQESAPAVEDTAGQMADMAEESAAEMADMAEDGAADMADAAEEATATAEEAMDNATAEADQAANTIASDAGGGMPRIDENSAQAQGLGYRNDATTVDASVQTRYAAGQKCSNCVLYQGGDEDWGPCPLFAGNLVKASGWCNAYAARA